MKRCMIGISAYVSQILHSPVYAGHIIYEAKPTVSMKSKKRRYIPFEERAIVPNTHEAIIPQDRWENVQRILYSRSGSFMCDKTEYDNIFKRNRSLRRLWQNNVGQS